MRELLFPFIYLLAASASHAALSAEARLDEVDRIVAAVGVDAMHSVNEEARTRTMAMGMLEGSPDLTSLRASPDIERVVRHLMSDQRRMRRDPAVFQAYRSTLEHLLSSAQLKAAADFYSTSTGLKVHVARIEAEKAASAALEKDPAGGPGGRSVAQAFRDTFTRMLTPDEGEAGVAFYDSAEGRGVHEAVLDAEQAAGEAMDLVAEQMQSVPPPNFTHYFAYGIDVFFRRDASDLVPLQRERIVSILRKPRDADPGTVWCVLLTGFDGTGEQPNSLAKYRRDGVEAVVTEFGVRGTSILTQMQHATSAVLKVGEASSSIVEIEQFPCDRR